MRVWTTSDIKGAEARDLGGIMVQVFRWSKDRKTAQSAQPRSLAPV